LFAQIHKNLNPRKKTLSQVLPRFELGSLDSKSKVLTATP
jgi:hypothetical protein